MAEAAHETEGEQQINREQKKIVDDTERAGGTVHEFNPDATPQQKAAALRKVISTPLFQLRFADKCGPEHAARLGFEECRSWNCVGHRHGTHLPPDF